MCKKEQQENPLISCTNKSIIPKALQIEPIFGCNANCTMCVINKPTNRKKMAMPMNIFKKIVDDITPYNDIIEQIDLFGLGEPLLDKNIIKKIRYLKKNRLKSVGISTNVELMDKYMQDQLLESGLDTIIFSIDSTKKEIHEKIRVNTNFERVIKNANSIIDKRNKHDYNIKFIFRYINQPNDTDGWEEYKNYWNSRINRNKGDQINIYNAHNWVGEYPLELNKRSEDIETLECYQIFYRMTILSDGTVSMCSCDFLHPHISVGNVVDSNTIDIFNSKKMNDVRAVHLSGKKRTIKTCRQCIMLYSREKKVVF